MKKLVTLISAAIVVFSSFAQTRNSQLVLSIGPSFPTGIYNNDDIQDEDAGGAQLGFNATLTFTHKFGGKNFGYALMVNNTAHQFNVDAFAEEFGGTWEADPYDVIGIYAGGFSSASLSEKVFFDTKILIGFGVATSPKVSGSFTDDGFPFTVDVSAGDATAFSYVINGGLRFDVSEKIGILLSLEYCGLKPTFPVTTTIRSGSFVDSEDNDLEQKMSWITTGAGVVFKLK